MQHLKIIKFKANEEKGIIVFYSLCKLYDRSICRNGIDKDKESNRTEKTTGKNAPQKSKLTLGGYGEAVMTRNFYSDNINRYSKAEDYKNAKSHGQFDLPHVVIMIGYDFGKGWTMGSEIEFEHGGTESAVEMEQEEVGEWEKR